MTRILVIEDEAPLREEISDILMFEGFDVMSAENGRVGLDLARKNAVDLIVCDITMPEMDGYQVLSNLREDTRAALIPFLFLTARADKSFMRHGMELGADDYVTKPFTHQELLSAIRSRLQRHSAIADAHQLDLEEVKTQLTRMVTHELRTPLISIRMVRDVIDRQLDHLGPEEIKELMGTLRLGTERLNHMVEQMVYLTHVETGSLSADRIAQAGQRLEVWQVLVGATDLARRYAYRNPVLQIDFQERDRAATVIGHIASLKHAFAEFIANALDFSNPDSAVSINQWMSKGTIWVSVIDYGRGIKDSAQQQAGKKFQQIDRASQEQQGMGLGVYVARRIIEAHGGIVQISSVEGKGTRVNIGLPMCESVVDEEH
jgi:two-component system sensor histidine kinase/response regulator